MISNQLLNLSKIFYKFASEINLADRLKLLDGWDGTTEVSTPRIFFREIKSQPFKHQQKIQATRLIFEIRKLLSEWATQARSDLQDDLNLFLAPSDYYYIDVTNILSLFTEFQPLIKLFGGSKFFQDEHLKKFFRSFKIFLTLNQSWESWGEIDLELYSELISIDLSKLKQILLQKLQKKISAYQQKIKKEALLSEQEVVDSIRMIAGELNDARAQKIYAQLPDLELKVSDFFRETLEDSGSFVEFIARFEPLIFNLLSVSRQELRSLPGYVLFLDHLQQVYLYYGYIPERIAKFKKLIFELQNSNKIKVKTLSNAIRSYESAVQ